MTDPHQESALEAVRVRYDRPVMNNIQRSEYIECLVASLLGPPWKLPWTRLYDWAPWDLEHPNGTKLEIKQSAALQPWHLVPGSKEPPTRPTFDIAERKGYYDEYGDWTPHQGRIATVYLFAWHGETDPKGADHRDPDQWSFYVVGTENLPDQKTIALSRIHACWLKTTSRALAHRINGLLTCSEPANPSP